MSRKPSGPPTRYGWNTPVTAPGPDGSSLLRRVRDIIAQPLPYLEHVWTTHGDVIQFPIPKPATYLVSSPAGARDVLVNLNRDMGKRTVQYTSLSLVTGEGLLTADTQAWKPRRKMLQPAFHHEMVALVSGHVSTALINLDQRWSALTGDGPVLVDIDQEMMSLALEITGKTLFGVDLSGEAQELTDATIDALHGVIDKAQSLLPIPMFVPTPKHLRMKRAIKRLNRAVDAIVAMRRRDLLPDDAPIRDMLDVLLDPDVEVPLTQQQVRDEIVTFIVAGHETVASALTWAIHLLGAHPDEAHALREDPTRAVRVFDETLRLFPPAWVITRRVNADVEIEGYVIPKNAMVIVSPWLVHRHPGAWANPHAFEPDRFAEGTPQLGYIPFGAGPRLCIGRDMARLEATQILSHIYGSWNIEPVHAGDVAIEASVTLRPVSGLVMRISPRS